MNQIISGQESVEDVFNDDNDDEHAVPLTNQGLDNKKRVITISRIEKLQLFTFFVEGKVESAVSSAEKRLIVKELQSLEMFQRLSSGQIRNQLESYIKSANVRYRVGSLFIQITDSLIHDVNSDFIENSLFPILSAMYNWFSELYQLNCLPTEFCEFLSRCYKSYIDKNSTSSTNNNVSHHLHAGDYNYLRSFENYIRCVLYPAYRNVWAKFASFEAKSLIERSGSVLGDLCCEIDHQRTLWGNKNNDIYKYFQACVTIDQLIVKPYKNDTLYSHINDITDADKRQRIIRTAPKYVRDAFSAPHVRGEVHENNGCDALQLLLFYVFELNCWKYYKRNLAFKGVYVFSVATSAVGDNNESAVGNTNEPSIANNNTMLTHSESKIIEINVRMLNVIYYVAGYALRSALHVLDVQNSKLERLVFNRLHDTFCVSLSAAKLLNLPTQLIEQRQRIANGLTCMCSDLFDVIVDIERNIILPALNDIIKVAILGDSYFCYVESLIMTSGYYKSFRGKVVIALAGLCDDGVDFSVLCEFSDQITCNFFDVFCGAVANDSIRHINTIVNGNNVNDFAKLSFRFKVMTENIEKGDFDKENIL